MSTTTRTLRVSSRLRRDILLMATCGSFALLSGCQENADLANSQKAAEELQKISKEYTNELADLTHDSDINQVASRLEGFARSARSVSGTTAEQKKTATTLSATIASAAGGLRATEFTQIELDQMARRNMIATRTSSAMIIAAGAIERSDTSFTEAGNGMAMERESLKVQSEEISQRLSEHQANAAQLRQQQQRTSQQLDQMTLDAARLGRQAKDSGPIEAYPLIEESAEIRSRMIPVKAKVADAETRLALIEPQVESTNTERTNIASMIEATIRAERNIALMAEAVTAAGDAGKQRAATETREVERLLAEYMAVEKDAASPVFESALSNLEQAQRSGSSKGAKALASGASRMIGDLQAMRANGALAEARLFTALASAAEMTGISADEWNAMAASAMEVQETAREAARTAYQDALDKLASAGGLEATRQKIEQLMNALDGARIESDSSETAPPPMNARGSAPMATPGASGAGTGSGFMGMGSRGFDTPEALLEGLVSIQNASAGGTPPPGAMRDIMGMMYLENPQVLMQNQQAMQNTLSSLSTEELGAGNIGGKIVAEQSDSAEINMPSMRINIPLIKVDGKWFVNLSQWLENAQNAPAAPSGSGGRSGRTGRGR